MHIELHNVLLNLYYAGVAAAFLVREIFWLRIVMIFAASCVISYGIITSNYTVVIWNSIFLAINTVWVIRLYIERRPIPLSDDLEELYNIIFTEMSKQEFLHLWKQGTIKSAQNVLLCKKGELYDKVSCIVSGKVIVKKNNAIFKELGRGKFFAEMSFLTREPASADVFAEDEVTYITWSRKVVENMKKVYPELPQKLQLIISKDLVFKLQSR